MRKKVVCVVDDHGFVNDLVKTCFSSLFGEEFEFRYFSSGNQFSEYLDLDEEELDIVFLDMKMDDGDGVSVLNKLSSLHKNEVPLFILTALEESLVNYIVESLSDSKLNIVQVVSKNSPGSLYKEIERYKKQIIHGFKSECESFDGPKIPRLMSTDLSDFAHYIDECLVPFIQPKVNIKNDCVSGFELLARIIDPEHGVVLPFTFLPELNSIEKQYIFNIKVIERFMLVIEELLTEGYRFNYSINIDPMAISYPSFIEDLDKIIENKPMLSRWVTFELTETSELIGSDCNLKLAQLKMKGFKISIDDFGKGFSNLNRIKSLPYDEVKIDRKLICAIEHSVSDKQLVFTVINYLVDIGKSVVAEGVEHISTLNTLKTTRCTEVQGFYYSCPKPYFDIDSILYNLFITRINELLKYIDVSELSSMYKELFDNTVSDIEALSSIEVPQQRRDIIHKIKGSMATGGFNECLHYLNKFRDCNAEQLNSHCRQLKEMLFCYKKILIKFNLIFL
ncbi:EAL domain-containing response regulator [Vibrio sp. 99-8-1]|uniref:EAL domain-containing response regulator n=1 Tax=Vibrio sp. 99-8-1 TaxID=2607602 RepID=UPI00149330DC|nr:EAL domain-containing response regulator [Vibrio sp. 99-8-1]NOI67463.1 EAL domain-containing response regulator [Vibrio sp. 99-8-1]